MTEQQTCYNVESFQPTKELAQFSCTALYDGADGADGADGVANAGDEVSESSLDYSSGAEVNEMEEGYPERIVFQSYRGRCVQYDMPYSNIPTPNMWHGIDVLKVPASPEPSSLMYVGDFESNLCSHLNLHHLQYSQYSSQFRPLRQDHDEPEACSTDHVVNCYRIYRKYALLKEMNLIVSLPTIKLKPDAFQGRACIQWARNLAHNVVRNASVRLDNEDLERMDPVKMDFAAFLSKGGSLGTGSSMSEVPLEYERLRRCVPAVTLNCRQPWHYAMRSKSTGFPLFSLSETSPLEHWYDLEYDPLECISLLRYEDGSDLPTFLDPRKYRDAFEDIGSIQYDMYATETALLKVEADRMQKSYEAGDKHCLMLCRCPQQAIDPTHFTATVPFAKVLCLAWGVLDSDARRSANVKSFYGGPNDANGVLPHFVVNSKLSFHEGTIQKFSLPPSITSEQIPASFDTIGYGMHLYSFTHSLECSSTTTALDTLQTSLLVETCNHANWKAAHVCKPDGSSAYLTDSRLSVESNACTASTDSEDHEKGGSQCSCSLVTSGTAFEFHCFALMVKTYKFSRDPNTGRLRTTLV